MSRKTYRNRNVRKLMRLGRGSIAVTIPIDIVEQLKLKKGQRVVVRRKGRTILIRDWKK